MMLLTMLFTVLGVANVNAGEMISLQEVPFCSWDGWGIDAKSTGDADCAWVLDESTGQPYGDPSVINYADLSMYSRLVVTATDGTPRFLFNRDVDEGQWNEDESQSHLIDNTRGGWSAKYFTQEGDQYVVDLKLMTKEKGFAHLHAIKGANWVNVTVTSMEVEKVGKAKQIGWINLINNSDMEGDDESSFFSKTAQSAPYQSSISDGVGVNESRGIVVEATAKVAEAWDNQFWFRFTEAVPAETKYRVSFDYRADQSARVSTQAHAEPSDYIHYEMLGDVNFTPEWQTFTKEGVVTSSQSTADKQFLSVAFNLNELAEANNYYFDNIVFEVYKAGITAEFYSDVIQMDFGFDTNAADLVNAAGLPRLLFPKDCVTVKSNGTPVEIISVEAFADGRFYIFTEEALDEKAQILVSLRNPSDPAYHLIYTNGPGGDVPNFEDYAEDNYDVANVEDAYAYEFVKPTVIKADPEDGSFNLPNSIKEFKLIFDKPADCSKIEAKINKEKLTVSPAEGFAKEVTLVRSGDDLASGEYTITVTKIFCESPIVDNDYSDYTYTINVGKVEVNPNDPIEEIIPLSYFNDCADGGVPAGYVVYADGEEPEVRTEATGYGSGSRMFAFSEGGEFTRGLYLRTWYLSYGEVDDYALNLVGGKQYTVSYNLALWCTRNGHSDHYVKFQVIDSEGNVCFEDVSEKAAPNLSESKSAVKGSTLYTKKFSVDKSGAYVMKWIVCKNADGDEAGNDWYDVIIANLQVRYIPNIPGLEITQKFNETLEIAKSALRVNDDERHHGAAFDALDAAIKKYEAESADYTGPSMYDAAINALNAAVTVLQDHSTLINTYDPLPVQAQEIVDNFEGTKFTKSSLYTDLKSVAAKYVEKKIDKYVDEETGEEIEIEAYEAKPLTDDAELQAAITELKDMVATAQRFFTEGESLTSSDVGIKVLVDRVRQGAEGLKQLGVPETDELIVAANEAITDDDALAEKMKKRIKMELYNKLKDPNNNLFEGTYDENTEETITPTYNLTVFAKNPNTYGWKESAGVTEENCPGWTLVEGNAGLTNMWNGSYPGDIEGLPKDLCITQYHAANRIEQTITDLPAGIYTVMIDAAEWSDEFTPGDEDDDETIARKEANHELNRVYVKTSDTPVYEEGQEEPEQFKADARIDHYGQYVGRHENYLYDIDVTDGLLTIGVKWNNLAQFMFDRVKILLAAPAAGFDYNKAYEVLMAGIDETVASDATPKAMWLYDLNGRRINQAAKGVTIVKKLMSDGTIRTEKVLVK